MSESAVSPSAPRTVPAISAPLKVQPTAPVVVAPEQTSPLAKRPAEPDGAMPPGEADGRINVAVKRQGDELTLVDREFVGFPKPKQDKDGAHPDGQSGITTVKWADVGPMCLEKFCLEKRRVGIAELGVFPRLGRRIDGILGQDLLREFDEVSINYKTEVVTLTIGGGEGK